MIFSSVMQLVLIFCSSNEAGDEGGKALSNGPGDYLSAAFAAKDYHEFISVATNIRIKLTCEQKKKLLPHLVDTIGSERTLSYSRWIDDFDMGTESGRTCFLISMLIGERVADPLVLEPGTKKRNDTATREKLMRATFRQVLKHCVSPEANPVQGLSKEEKLSLAKKADCPADVAVRLSEDPDFDVRFAIAQNASKLPPEIQRLIMADPDQRIRALFVRSRKLEPDVPLDAPK